MNLRQTGGAALIALSVCAGEIAMSTETPDYQVIHEIDDVEFRRYEPYIVAETFVGNEYDANGAGNEGFRRLAGYIFGNNRRRNEIAMTAPVTQSTARQSQKISMTAPVNQSAESNGWTIQFMMPSGYTLDSLPEPVDSRIRFREVPARLVATVRYSGRWTESNYRQHERVLLDTLASVGVEPSSAPVLARYDAPYIPSFLRRNEVMVEVDQLPLGLPTGAANASATSRPTLAPVSDSRNATRSAISSSFSPRGAISGSSSGFGAPPFE